MNPNKFYTGLLSEDGERIGELSKESQTIDAKVGKPFTIGGLEVFGTTGYQWYPSFNPDEIKTLNRVYEGQVISRGKFKYSPGMRGVVQWMRANLPWDISDSRLKPLGGYSNGLAGILERIGSFIPRRPALFDRTREVFFDFAALREGTFKIILEYKRIWEKNKKPVQTETYIVNSRA